MSLPRITSRTSLQDPALLPSYRKKSNYFVSPFFMPHVAQLLGALQPRKPKHRTTFLALAFLTLISTCIFVFQNPAALALRRVDNPAVDQLTLALESIQNSRLKDNLDASRTQRTQVQLDAAQELAAVSSFLASLPQNVIPSSVDPSHPIDPQLILDFDTRSPRATEEVQAMVEDVWLRNPVFLYSKLYSADSREVKAILSHLRLRPFATVIDVDIRDDADVLKPIVARLTSTPELPVLIIGGRPVGSIEEIRELHKTGELKKLISASGAVINGAKRKKHRR
ncbi:hypothetical protein BDQ12DRAFT_620262 [Crucibulum laeve]|uniref:Uncharacterized protein n=1 Tax=Crucibulum laeve TaxID=68775 RepID=A0A5C3MK88_9AGAR|nr:hypothetical protein BDQ12DRAFT_620262 [Crucibulum laeve]